MAHICTFPTSCFRGGKYHSLCTYTPYELPKGREISWLIYVPLPPLLQHYSDLAILGQGNGSYNITQIIFQKVLCSCSKYTLKVSVPIITEVQLLGFPVQSSELTNTTNCHSNTAVEVCLFSPTCTVAPTLYISIYIPSQCQLQQHQVTMIITSRYIQSSPLL